jgi:1-deoxy-D-xylulose-5-phosphate synthase
LKKEFLDRYDVQKVLEENHLTPELIIKDVEGLL